MLQIEVQPPVREPCVKQVHKCVPVLAGGYFAPFDRRIKWKRLTPVRRSYFSPLGFQGPNQPVTARTEKGGVGGKNREAILSFVYLIFRLSWRTLVWAL